MMLKTRGKSIFIFYVCVLLSICLAVHAQEKNGASRVNDEKRRNTLDNMQDQVRNQGAAHPIRVTIRKDGYIRFLGAPKGTGFVVDGLEGPPEEVANKFISQNRHLFINDNPNIHFVIKRINADNSRHFVRYEQKYNDLTVFGADMIIQVDNLKDVGCVVSQVLTDPQETGPDKIILQPELDVNQAKQIAINSILDEDDRILPENANAELVIYDPVLMGIESDVQLVWKIEVKKPELLIHTVVLVNAVNGNIVFNYPLMHHAKNRWISEFTGRYLLEIPEFILRRQEWQGPRNIKDVDLAFDFLGYTYDFYYDHHGRDSIDGNGMKMRANVNYEKNETYWYINAIYIEKDGVTDDVVAHEYTHGVTEYTSGLIYANESGAINESLSDMWGEWVDQEYGNDDIQGLQLWQIGEDLDGGSIRNMQYPAIHGQPDRYKGENWNPCPAVPSKYNDWGWVHNNCGVGNKLCYLLTHGDLNFNGYHVGGYQIAGAADLFYHCQCNLLGQSSDYRALGDKLIQAAVNLGYSDKNIVNIKKALLAVEIYDDEEDWLWTRPASDTIQGETTKDITLDIIAPKQEGTYQKTIKITFDDPHTSTINIPVTVTVSDD